MPPARTLPYNQGLRDEQTFAAFTDTPFVILDLSKLDQILSPQTKGGILVKLTLEKQNISVEHFIKTINGSGPYCIRTLPDIPKIDHSKENYNKNWTFQNERQLQNAIRGGLRRANSHRNGVFLVVNNGDHCDASIHQVTAHFIDFDKVPMDEQLARLEAFGLLPSILDLPSRGLHSYWRVKDGDVSQFRRIQERLIRFFGSDPTVKNESRLMRLPGYFHQKASPKMVDVMWWHPEYVYTQEELTRRLDELGVPDIIEEKRASIEKRKTKKEHVAPLGIVDQTLLTLVQGHLERMETSDGEQYRCLCPMHDDHHPSGVYFAGNECFYCHTCQRSWRLSELATANGWNDVIEYREHRRIESRNRVQSAYSAELENTLSYTSTLSQYVHAQAKVESLDTRRIINDVLAAFVEAMKQRGIAPSQSLLDSVKLVIRLWEQLHNSNHPIVWPAMPGSGKSTLRDLYVERKCDIDPTFGCVLVVERKEDADRIAKFLNRSQEIAWSYLGWDRTWCLANKMEYERGMCRKCQFSSCRVLRNQDEQLRRPVVITTHQRFAELASKSKLGSTLGYWIDGNGERHERRLAIIDEAPPRIDRATANRADFTQLNKVVKKALTTSPSLLDEWSNVYTEVIGLFSDIVETRHVSLSEIDVRVSRDLTTVLTDLPTDTWPTLRRFLKNGGVVHKDEDDGFTVTVTERIAHKWDGLCPFVLDGTGTKDLRYPPSYQALPEIVETAPPVSLHVCTDFGFGKWYMARNQNKEVFEAHGAVAQSLAKKHHKLLMVVRKDYETEYLQLLHNEIKGNKITLAHFGDLKGRNKYQDCDAVLFLGMLDKGDEYYMASAVAGNENPSALCFDTVEYNNTHRFTSVDVEKSKLNEMALDLIQDIYRTQVRRGKPAHVYVFSRDQHLMDYVARLLGLPAIDLMWKPVKVVKLTKAEKHVTALLDALNDFVSSGQSSISKSALKEQIGVADKSDKVWRRAWSNPYVLAFCHDHGIIERAANSRMLERANDIDKERTHQTA